MTRIAKTLALMTPLLFIGCGGGSSSSGTIDEGLKGGKLVVDFSPSSMKNMLVEKRFITEETEVFGYKAYSIPYITTDEEGEDVNVSGLFVIPTGMPSAINNIGFSMVSDSHGTIFKNSNAPTVYAEDYGMPEGSPILFTAIGGFATLQADYIGFGNSDKHYHPYMLKESLANATIDFIKQVKIFAKENNIKLNQQLFLTGYSEGGYTTMATLKKIEEEEIDLDITMAIPMASAGFSMLRVSENMLLQEKLVVPAMVANLVYAYSIAYNKDVGLLINEPYASRLPTLFNGTKSMQEIDANLTTVIKGKDGFFKEDAVQEYLENDTHWYKEALRENSVDDWIPQTAVGFLHCEGDEITPFSESNMTFHHMKDRGAENIEMISLEKRVGISKKLTHMECAIPSYKLVTEMFADIRKTTIGY